MSATASRGARRALRLVVVTVICLITLLPLYWMVIVALSSRRQLFSGTFRMWPGGVSLDNFRRVLDGYPVQEWFLNSVAIAVVTALLTVVLNVLAGYAFAILRFRGQRALFAVALATLMLPVQVIMVALFRLVTTLNLYGTYWAVILPTSASAFGLFLTRQFMRSLPNELVEAARIDGAGHLRVLTSIILPMSKPLLAVLFFTSLLQSWNDFAWPLIALKQNQLFTLPIGLLYLQGQFGSDYGAIMAFALIDVVPIVIVFLIFQRFFVQGFARAGLR